jgi:two-component system phosphate regulon sensor histidine kinase PhoR
VRSKHGFQGAVALLLDVTEVRKLEQMRIDFVANVSHELRTPLAAVLGALETVAEPGTDEATTRRFLELAQRNASRLQAIVSDLLELSSIESQSSRMAVEPLGIGSPVRSAAAALAGAAESKGVALLLEPLAPELPPIPGNHERLERVFTNLIENAIKYTPKGGHVRVRARLAGRALEIEVEDDGVGIPAAHLPRVFERFYRVDRSRSREMGGTGLGLAIVKHIVRAHGGNVEVESEEGRGALFRVRLPVLDARSAARSAAG